MPDDLKPGERLADQSQMGIFTAGDKPYLGDPKVVLGILRDLVDVVSADPEEGAIEGAIEDAVEVLCGRTDEYAPMGKWNTEDGLGNWIRGHMKGVPDGDTAEAVRFALAHLALHWMDGFKAMDNGSETPKDLAPKLERIMHNWVGLMVGIPVANVKGEAP